MARQIVVDVIGDSKGLNRTLDDATTRTGKFGSVMKGVGMGIGFGVFGLVTEGIGMMVGKLGEAKDAYQEDLASQAKLEQALKNVGAAYRGANSDIEARIEAQMRLGFADDVQRDSLALLVGSLGNVTDAQNAQRAAMDLARLKGIDLVAASNMIIQAEQGKMRGLASVGIELKKGATLTEILGAVTEVAGGQAEAYANGPLGKQEAAQLKVGEAMEKVGSAVSQVSSVLIPIAAEAFTMLIDVFMEVWDAIQPIVDVLIKELGPVFKEVVGIVQGTVIPVLRTLFTAVLPPLKTWITLLATVTKTAFGVIVAVIKGAVSVIGPIIAGLVRVFNGISTAITSVKTIVGNAVKAVVGFFSGIGTKIGNATRGMFDGIWNAFRSVLNMIIRGWNSIQFTLPRVDLGPLGTFGGFTLGTPNLPYFHEGGIVPGTGDVPIMAKGGERVLTQEQQRGLGGVTIVMNGNVYGTDGVDDFADIIVRRMRTLGAW